MTFDEAYEHIVAIAEELDVRRLYYNMGFSLEYADNSQRLSVALVLLDSGLIHVESEISSAIKKAARNMVDFGQVKRESLEVRAETMDKMRHLI